MCEIMRKKITILNPCFNEEENVGLMYEAIKNIMSELPQYDYEHIFVDNCSTDRTFEILKKIAAKDRKVKVIENLRNFGPDRSGVNALYHASGDAVISLASDFQDPPQMIPQFIAKWEEGEKIVWGQRNSSDTNIVMQTVRKLYYKIINSISDCEEIEQCTGFGIMDREVIDWIKWINDPDPFLRNIIVDLGYKPCLLPYKQGKRIRGKSSYNIFRYVDTALLSMVTASKKPLRIATYIGGFTAFTSMVLGVVYLILKLCMWDQFDAGMAPVLIGMFFLGAIQLICIGIVGEYVGAVLTRVKKRPLAVEKEMLNFENEHMTISNDNI